MTLMAIAVLWLLTSCTLLALGFRRTIAAAWREPVLRVPVLVLESDDWGYGPAEQAPSLSRIAELLCRFRDGTGRAPVMTLGVVLAGPDTAWMSADGGRRYQRIAIDDPRLAAVRDAMLAGRDRRVFALHLHGREHYWPDSLMRAADASSEVRAWFASEVLPSTEALPSSLQCRWIDCAALPSKPLAPERLAREAAEEVRCFRDMLGEPAVVAVPPTFTWTSDVETAWSRAGIRVVVTPGRRSEARDEGGRPVFSADTYYNGQTGPGDLTYVVRDSYFEPSLGHTHERGIEALAAKTRLGRPTLIETHRKNYIGQETSVRGAIEELRRLLEAACAGFPRLHFMSTAELADHYRGPTSLVASDIGSRLHVFLRRLATHSRLRKLAWITGAILPAWVVFAATRMQAPRGAS